VTIIVPKWPGCCWFSHLEQLTIDTPARIPALARNLSSTSRAPAQQVLEVGSLQDLWLPNPAGWSSAAANLLNNALAASTWKRYTSNYAGSRRTALLMISHFPQNIGAVAIFLESATWSSQQPCSTIDSLSAAIGALYKTTDFHPTWDPLLS